MERGNKRYRPTPNRRLQQSSSTAAEGKREKYFLHKNTPGFTQIIEKSFNSGFLYKLLSCAFERQSMKSGSEQHFPLFIHPWQRHKIEKVFIGGKKNPPERRMSHRCLWWFSRKLQILKYHWNDHCWEKYWRIGAIESKPYGTWNKKKPHFYIMGTLKEMNWINLSELLRLHVSRWPTRPSCESLGSTGSECEGVFICLGSGNPGLHCKWLMS